MYCTALVVGVIGIAGYNTAQSLLGAGWRVVGLSRKRATKSPASSTPRRTLAARW